MLLCPVETGQGWLRWEDGEAEEARTGLLAEYRRLVRVELPAAARAGSWELRRDHCFARVILDAVCGGCWYAHLARERSAEGQLDAVQLARALQVGRGMLADGAAEVARLNAQSLRWRGKGGIRAPRRSLSCRRPDAGSISRRATPGD